MNRIAICTLLFRASEEPTGKAEEFPLSYIGIGSDAILYSIIGLKCATWM
jgi:hypothetical protein